ncbi:MAG TPA: phosphoglycerate kinase [Terriglobales bacterium]|nr:phosphoglycerate kinase [Terriglobales bacterium]
MKKTVRDIDVAGKRVLLRCDLNVPLEGGAVADDTRLTASLPTIRYLLEQGASVVLCSHLGRPKGAPDPKYSLAPVAEKLSELLGRPVPLITEYEQAGGDICLLENLRFYPGEEKNDPEFAKRLAGLADIYVNDAFGSAHRAHASTAGVAGFLPAVCGFLIEKELSVMGGALRDPRRPFIAVLGGAKVSDKIGVTLNLLSKVDAVVVGGGMAYTFVAALGGRIGNSLCETDKLGLAMEIWNKAARMNVPILLPEDSLCAMSPDGEAAVMPSNEIEEGYMGLDIGPAAVERFAQVLGRAGTVVWNGPMGMFEKPAFKGGTLAVATAIAESGCVSIVGGGDSAAAAEELGFADRMTHISTGGGASLEFLEGRKLPGIECLLDA